MIIYDKDNSLEKVAEVLEAENPSSILLLTAKNSYQNGPAKEKLERLISGYDVIHVSDFSTNPPIEDLKKLVQVINNKKCDFIIAIGGGSVLDIGKTASVLCPVDNNMEAYIKGEKEFPAKTIKTLLIPTTAGTGSEATPFAVITIDKTKYPFGAPSLYADYVILDASLTYSLPPKVTASTAVDALAQAIEAYWSTQATEESMSYSIEAIDLLKENIVNAVNAPNPRNRQAVLRGAHFSGKAIAIAKTTAGHALSYPLTSIHGIAHGHAVMLSIPCFFVINENLKEDSIQEGFDLSIAKKRYAELLEILGVQNGQAAKSLLTNLMKECHLETRLSELSITKEDLELIAENGCNPTRIINNPVKVSTELIIDLLNEIY